MSFRRYASRILEGILLVAVVALVLGAVLGQPILFGFVETGSMAPALEPGDGFVAVPSVLAGEVQPGDVVVFEAEVLHDGGLTTHRVVEERPGGYVTKGDANPFTDQDGPEPLVTEDQIVAKAWSIGDWVVAIPYLGMAVLMLRGVASGLQRTIANFFGLGPPYGTQGAGIFLLTMGAIVLVLTAVQEYLTGPSRDRSRSRNRPGTVDTRKLTAIFLVVVLLPANAAMLIPGGTDQLVVEGDAVADSPEIEPGEPANWEYSINNYGLVPVAFTFESPDESATVPDAPQVLGPRGSSTAEVSMAAPPPGERAVADVREYRYLLVLPPGVIATLHDVDPLVALLTINLVLVAAVLLVSGRLLGFGLLRLRWGSGTSLRTRIRRRYF